MLTLADGALTMTVDPTRGAEVRSLQVDGRELLFQAPWPPTPLGSAPHDAAAWEGAWRGGWQLLVPNAGEPCTVAGRAHGFHGAASVSEFTAVERSAGAASLRWQDETGLLVERHYRLGDGAVVARTRLVNTGAASVPYLLVEHLTLGDALAAEGVTIELPGGTLSPQRWDGVETATPTAWPVDDQGDWSRLGPAPLSRFGVVRDVPTGRASVTAPDGLRLELRWSVDALPHVWLWQERCGSDLPPWNGSAQCLAIEPASAPAADGLAAHLARRTARSLPPGSAVDTCFELTPRAPEARP